MIHFRRVVLLEGVLGDDVSYSASDGGCAYVVIGSDL